MTHSGSWFVSCLLLQYTRLFTKHSTLIASQLHSQNLPLCSKIEQLRGFCLGAHTMHRTLPKQTIATSRLLTKTNEGDLRFIEEWFPINNCGYINLFSGTLSVVEITCCSLQYATRLMYCRSQINRSTHRVSTAKYKNVWNLVRRLAHFNL